jgi:hypothetical protein
MIKLDLCCSTRKPEGFFGIDILPFKNVDQVYDLNKGIPMDDNSCEIVRAHDAIEHIRDGLMIMKEIWRVCDHGALVDILVPSTDGRGAFQDLTHVSFWNQNSFGYWINNFDWMDYYRGPCLFTAEELYTTQMSTDGVCHVVFKGRAVKDDNWMFLYRSRINK